jgi:hypothetical protein
MFRKGKKLLDKKIILESIFKPDDGTYIVAVWIKAISFMCFKIFVGHGLVFWFLLHGMINALTKFKINKPLLGEWPYGLLFRWLNICRAFQKTCVYNIIFIVYVGYFVFK